MELPDFHIDHAEKIEWMIETNGWALEAGVGPAGTRTAGAELRVLDRCAGRSWFRRDRRVRSRPGSGQRPRQLVVDACRGGTEIPLGVELVGSLDNELRCMFAPVDLEEHGDGSRPAFAWYRGEPFEIVQLLFPDRNGFLPYEAGYDQRMRFAQPVLGTI